MRSVQILSRKMTEHTFEKYLQERLNHDMITKTGK